MQVKPTVESHTLYEPSVPGSWAVTCIDHTWSIINKDTGRTKKIGPVLGINKRKRVNYFDRALAEADNRNRIETGAPRPCPCCGGQALTLQSSSSSDERCGYNFTASVRCMGCGLEMSVESRQNSGGWCTETPKHAIARAVAKWNVRTK